MIFLVYNDGHVIDEEEKVICKTGGQPCLEDYILMLINKAQAEEVTLIVKDEMLYFYIYPDTSVFDSNRIEICKTGGAECLNEYILTLMDPFDDVIYIIDNSL